MCISCLNFFFQGIEHPWLPEPPMGCGGWWVGHYGCVGGASPDVMDPRPENLNPGISMDEIRGGVHGSQLCGE